MNRIKDQELKARYIQQFELDKHLPAELIAALIIKTFDKGEYIYRQEEEAQHFCLLVEGRLQVDSIHFDGTQTVISFVEPLSVLGDLELFEDFPNVKNAHASRKSVVLTAPKDIVQRLGGRSVPFLRFLIKHIVRKLEFASSRIEQSSLSFDARLAGYLLVRFDEHGPEFILDRREDTAAILGSSVRHLNRTLREFDQQGVVLQQGKKIQILDQEKLVSIFKSIS